MAWLMQGSLRKSVTRHKRNMFNGFGAAHRDPGWDLGYPVIRRQVWLEGGSISREPSDPPLTTRRLLPQSTTQTAAPCKTSPCPIKPQIIGHNLPSAWMPDSLTNSGSNRRPVSHTLNRFQKCDTGKPLKPNGTQSQKIQKSDTETGHPAGSKADQSQTPSIRISSAPCPAVPTGTWQSGARAYPSSS